MLVRISIILGVFNGERGNLSLVPPCTDALMFTSEYLCGPDRPTHVQKLLSIVHAARLF